MKYALYIFLSAAILGCSPAQVNNSSTKPSTDNSSEGTGGSGTSGGDTQTPALEKLKAISNEYRAKYALNDVFAKLVDNRGNNFAALYGVRNFRVVLHGVYYRGGANNSYNTVDGVRSNENPLPSSGLTNLCEENFKEAIYLYSTNYSGSVKSVTCRNYKNETNTLAYDQISPLTYTNNEKFIQKVYNIIKGKSQGPIYGHCWNGWHASGYVGAVLLKQFCGYSDQRALDYWVKNTDGGSAGHESVMAQVTAFKPISKYQISAEESALICP